MSCDNKVNNKIVAGIVLYNPNLKQLEKNIALLLEQVNRIIIFDNGSQNQVDIIRKFKISQITLITSDKNNGIAYALNEISKKAIKLGFLWLLTLDQDSIIRPNLVSIYKSYINQLTNIGQISCAYEDRNTHETYDTLSSNVKVAKVKECITSGTLLNLKALKKVGGFDNSLFIDYVDIDLCFALRTKNYYTYRINYVGLYHELGHMEKKKTIFGNITVLNHNAMRHYYIARNQIIICRRFPKQEKKGFVLLSQIFRLSKVIIFEKDKSTKVKEIFRGIKDGLTIKKERDRYV